MQAHDVRRLVAMLLLSLILAGCQTSGGSELISSSTTMELGPEAARGIAGDLVGGMTEQVAPGTNTIRLQTSGTDFGQALEASLKGWGYAVATDQEIEDGTTVPLAYVIDSFGGNVLARLSSPSFDLTRIYRLGTDGAQPVSPLSIMQRNTGHP